VGFDWNARRGNSCVTREAVRREWDLLSRKAREMYENVRVIASKISSRAFIQLGRRRMLSRGSI
jgi:hypothetical protein